MVASYKTRNRANMRLNNSTHLWEAHYLFVIFCLVFVSFSSACGSEAFILQSGELT